MNENEKKELIKKYSPHSTIIKNVTFSFLFGGLICLLGELILRAFIHLGLDGGTAGMLVTVTLIGVASLMTSLGVFDSVARIAGAGTLVPVTGFSNAVTSSAMDSKSEGVVLGVGAKIFTVAGPVILFGIITGVAYGAIYYVAGILTPYL